jgi:uncharacterized membrane protein YkvA (DUF1232 family)
VSGTGNPADPGPYVEALRQGLRDLGYIDGKNIAIEYRGAEGKPERYASLVNELIQRKVDVIVVPTLPAILAARTWYAKALIFFVVAHTFSPLDLIPDFSPVLGYLDDLIITPGGIWLAVRLIPPEVLEEAQARAATQGVDRRVGIVGAGIIILIWILAIIWGATIILRMVERS